MTSFWLMLLDACLVKSKTGAEVLETYSDLLRFYSAAKLVFCGLYMIMWKRIMPAVALSRVRVYLENDKHCLPATNQRS